MELMSGIDRFMGRRQWSVRQKLLFGNLFVVGSLFVLCTVILYLSLRQWQRTIEQDLEAAGASVAESVETALNEAVRQYMSDLMEKTLHQATRTLAQDKKDNPVIAAAGKQLLGKDFETRHIGRTGYLMGFDSKGIVQFHPDETFVGKHILKEQTYREFWPLFKQQMGEKQQQVVSHQQPENSRQGRSRRLVLSYFEPCDWIVVGIWYPEEIVRFIDFLSLKQWMGNVRYGRSGVAFLLDTQGKVLLHPVLKEQAAAVLTAHIAALPGWRSLGKTQTVCVQWQEPPEQADLKQFLYLGRLPRYDMIVGITTEARSVFADFKTVRLVTIILLVTGAACAITGTVMLNTRIAAPLWRVLQRVSPSGYDPDGGDGNEISALSRALTELERCALQSKQGKEKLTVETQRRKSAEAFLQIYKRIFDSAGEGMMITDGTGRILAVNESFTNITGYQQAEVISRNPRSLQSGQHGAEFYEQMWQSLDEKGVWEGEIWNRKKDGTIYPQWLTINRLQSGDIGTIHYFASFYEIGELKKREKQIAFMANYDILTRLPNRLYFEQKLTRSLARVRRDGGKLALLYIDLDNFKNINDVFGHSHGDDLLQQASQRFSSLLDGNDVLCRIGGDEFILLLERVENDSLIFLTASRISAVLKEPFILDFKKMYINASIGIAVYPGDGEIAQDLIRSADMAMYQAKREGKNRYARFSKDMHNELYEKLRMETGIRYGLLNREFVVHYQPKVKIATRRTSSLEALVRWQKAGKMISPGAFIPIAEESNLIDEICLFVLQETCAFYTTMQQQGVAVPVSVNISPRQFHNLDFVDIVEDLIRRFQIDPRYLEFEITETTAMHDVAYTLKIMHRLRDLGIYFSIDDFGTGYSSLGSLSKMPVNTLKIDKQFIDDLETNSGIISTIIAISQQMRLNVVAEGVETEEQLLRLDAMGCHEVQGYYFSRPMPSNSILEYLLAERNRPAQ